MNEKHAPASPPPGGPDQVSDATTGLLENHPIDEIRPGDEAELVRTVTSRDIQLLASISSEIDPLQIEASYARSGRLDAFIAHGMLGNALIATLLGTRYPGPGTTCLALRLQFLKPVQIGDTLTVRVSVRTVDPASRRVLLAIGCVDQHGDRCIEGETEVLAPQKKAVIRHADLPEPVRADQRLRHEALLAAAQQHAPIPMGVVHPCSREALEGALEAARLHLMTPILIGPAARIRELAASHGCSLDGIPLVDVPHSHAAAAKAVGMARNGEVEALMKGSLHSDELMAEVVSAATGLRTKRRASHVFVLDVPSYPKPLLISDAAINIEPDLDAKADIVRNAIDLAHALGITEPRVAILSAVETVSSKMRSALDAAALAKMADRGQIVGGIVDGPLAFDNAVSMAAATIKGIQSPVAGSADILIVPDLESGNMLAKQLEYLGGAQAAGIVMGARVPIVLTSRADSAHSRIASCAIALILAHRYRVSPP